MGTHSSYQLGCVSRTVGWSRYRDANPVPNSALAGDIATAPSEPMCFTYRKEGRKCFIKRRTQHILFTVIWRQTYGTGPIAREETRFRHVGYSFRLAARVIVPTYDDSRAKIALCNDLLVSLTINY